MSIFNQYVKALLEAEYPQTFDWNYFNSLTKFKDRFFYAQSHLSPLGEPGSSRRVFVIDDDTVLKLAINKKGVTQNKRECDPTIQQKYPHVVTKTFRHDPNYLWVEAERVRPLTYNDLDEFKEKTGFHLGWFAHLVLVGLQIFQDFNGEWPEGSEKVKQDFENSLFAQELVKMMVELGQVGDISRISSYGITKSEKIKLLDYGINNEIYNTLYKKMQKTQDGSESRNT